ncbi:MAG: hypothetical protein LBF81_07360 [Prevotellaceae bacterium]|jgi:uncharacterized protein (TIGR02145 family)|nr:hypothetical protein [Prevotellaceae bacterium]
MKKIFFLFAMLASMTASAAVTVTPLSTDYAAKKVTFKVKWTDTPTAPYNNRVWVWIDFCQINGVTPQSFSTTTITSPTKTGGNGTITNVTTRGFFIEDEATNTGTTVTAILSNAPAGKFNWCVYGSDYPPNVLANTNGYYKFAGTQPFKLIEANGTTTQTIDGTTIATTAVTVTPATITDATGYLGLWCPYTGSDLYMDATHRCRERQSGAYNWEAWIKDARDGEWYRIVKMPDNKWWLAQNVKYAKTGIENANVGCTPDKCGRCYTGAQMSSTYTGSTGASGYGTNKQGICPNDWKLPTTDTWKTFVFAIENVTLSNDACGGTLWQTGVSATVVQRLTSTDYTIYNGNDYYGWANATAAADPTCCPTWRSNDTQYHDFGFRLRANACSCEMGYYVSIGKSGEDRNYNVRCFRQL